METPTIVSEPTEVLHPSKYDPDSSCTHVLVEVGGRAVKDCGPGSVDEMNGGIRKWQHFANCFGMGKYHPDSFYDPGSVLYDQSVCQACVVRPECEDYAIFTKQRAGVWGGQEIYNLKTQRAARLRTSRLGLARAAGVEV